jgi:hypothetical protein
MNGWQIVLEYLRVLAWPLVVIFLLWRFKAQMGRLLDRLVSLKTPIGTAEFDRQARELSMEAQEAALEEVQFEQSPRDGEPKAASDASPSEQAAADMDDRPDETQSVGASPRQSGLPAYALRALTADEFQVYRDVAAADPATAVTGAWRRIEQFAHVALRAFGQVERWSTSTTMLKQLQEVGLGAHFLRVADELRRLRNSVAHGGTVEITPAGALDYIDAAERLADALVMLQIERPSSTQ